MPQVYTQSLPVSRVATACSVHAASLCLGVYTQSRGCGCLALVLALTRSRVAAAASQLCSHSCVAAWLQLHRTCACTCACTYMYSRVAAAALHLCSHLHVAAWLQLPRTLVLALTCISAWLRGIAFSYSVNPCGKKPGARFGRERGLRSYLLSPVSVLLEFT